MERITKLVIRYLFIIIAVTLFVLPFFWFKNGEIDLGGDSSRLYFYNPLAYIQSHSLYGVSSSGLGAENISYYALPFIISLYLLQLLITSPNALTAFFHGFTLAIAFLAVYGSVKSILISGRITTHKKNIDLSAVIAGLLYVFSPSLIYGWDKAIITHNEFFLNPLLFFLLLRFFISQKSIYLYMSLIVTFVFSANFSFVGAPSFFAFYPIAIFFLLFYTKIILRKPLHIRQLLVAGILFLGLQFFHLLPQFAELVEKSSPNNQALFSDQGKLVRGLLYFISIAASVKVSRNFFILPQQAPDMFTHVFFIILPLIIVASFLIKRSRTAILLGLFFLFILFLASANITQVGFEAYKQLFSIPGFSMFRNYWGKWLFSYDFFYVLLFGVAFATIAEKIKPKYVSLLAVGLMILLFVNSINFISGALLNKNLWDSKRKIFISMDPNIKSAIKAIKSLNIDGKILTLPLADPGYQIFIGENGGAYQGPSLIAYLAAKKDFAGYEDMGPYGTPFLEAVRAKQYDEVNKMLAFLNVKYVFYNSSPLVYDDFPNFPYQYVRQFLPPDQRTYPRLINNLKVEPIGSLVAIYLDGIYI